MESERYLVDYLADPDSSPLGLLHIDLVRIDRIDIQWINQRHRDDTEPYTNIQFFIIMYLEYTLSSIEWNTLLDLLCFFLSPYEKIDLLYKEPTEDVQDVGVSKNVRRHLLTSLIRALASYHVATGFPASVRKRRLSNMFLPHSAVDRCHPLSLVTEYVNVGQNARRCFTPSEEHAAKVFQRFRNTSNNDFRSPEAKMSKPGNNYEVQYLTLTGNVLPSVVRANS
ncbi:hypothetical protein Tco_0983232 [Tanacetum coccineum]